MSTFDWLCCCLILLLHGLFFCFNTSSLSDGFVQKTFLSSCLCLLVFDSKAMSALSLLVLDSEAYEYFQTELCVFLSLILKLMSYFPVFTDSSFALMRLAEKKNLSSFFSIRSTFVS